MSSGASSLRLPTQLRISAFIPPHKWCLQPALAVHYYIRAWTSLPSHQRIWKLKSLVNNKTPSCTGRRTSNYDQPRDSLQGKKAFVLFNCFIFSFFCLNHFGQNHQLMSCYLACGKGIQLLKDTDIGKCSWPKLYHRSRKKIWEHYTLSKRKADNDFKKWIWTKAWILKFPSTHLFCLLTEISSELHGVTVSLTWIH